MPRPVPSELNRDDFSDSDWVEISGALNDLPPGIDVAAADAIYDFKNKIEDFLEPLSVFDEIEEVQYRADFAEYDFLSSWFRGQLAEGELEDDLGHLYGLYLGFLLQTNYQRLGATWTLDPRPNSPTYLKPVIGPFACAQPMKYIDPFLYVKESWIEELPMEAHQLVRLVSSWYQDAAEQMSSSPLETHFYRKMNGILPEF